MLATRIVSVLVLLLAVSYSQQAQGVCIFDMDGTLIGVKDRSLSRAAVAACEAKGFKIAINTAEPDGICRIWDWINKGSESGVTYGGNVPKKMWMCRGLHFDGTTGKVINMRTAMKYYNSSKKCMVLFDDKAENVKAVVNAGFQGQQINFDGLGISVADRNAAILQLDGCEGTGKVTRIQRRLIRLLNSQH